MRFCREEFRPQPLPKFSRYFELSWRRELNPRPSDYKSDALPTELRQHWQTERNYHTGIRIASRFPGPPQNHCQSSTYPLLLMSGRVSSYSNRRRFGQFDSLALLLVGRSCCRARGRLGELAISQFHIVGDLGELDRKGRLRAHLFHRKRQFDPIDLAIILNIGRKFQGPVRGVAMVDAAY